MSCRGSRGRRPTLTVTIFDRGRNARPAIFRLARLRGLAHGLRPLRPVANGEANGALRVHSERRSLLACRNGFRTRNVQWRRNSMRRLLFCIVFLLSSVALTVGVPIRGGAQGQPTVSIMVGGLEKIIYLPEMLTERLGYFKEAGVDVTLYNEGAGVSAEDEMLAGRVDGVVGFYDHSIDLQSKGKYVEAVIILDRVPGEALVVSNHSGITSLAGLKGKRIGVTGLGPPPTSSRRFWSRRVGAARESTRPFRWEPGTP